MSISKEYRSDLKSLRKLQKECNLQKLVNDSSTVGGMISSTEYSLFWIENGYERPLVDNSPTKAAKANREQLWGEIEHAKGIESGVCDVYFWEETEATPLTDKQLDRFQDVNTIMRSFSNQELNVFILKNQDLMEVKDIAKTLKLTEKSVYRTIDRIASKIEDYFTVDQQQLALFG